VATTNIDRIARTAREMTEVQRDSYEALTTNLTALQQRNVELAQGGLKFLKLQEDNARAAQEWFANGVKLLQLQQRNVKFTQNWLTSGAEALQSQTEQNRQTAEVFSQGARKQQENFRALAGEWVGAYQDFFSPFVANAQEGLSVAQETTQQALQTTQQAAQQGLRLAEETTAKTEQVVRETQEATQEAALQAAVFGALKTADYNELNVDEVSKKLDGLSAEELKKVRKYEKQNKNRDTLVEQIDRKIKATS
jgi:hypothetical protein